MTPHNPARRLDTPSDPHIDDRVARLHALGIHAQPDEQLDACANEIARLLDAPYAMVNFLGLHRRDGQYFAGLYAAPPPISHAFAPDHTTSAATPGREMDRDHGYCPHVIDRACALPLRDVCANPHFSSNPVVDSLGVRAYLGTPIFDPTTQQPLGTLCVVDRQVHPWGTDGVELIKSKAAEVAQYLTRRTQLP